ncbi:rubredoxin [Bengtsoniella intestinalis]|uniref:rubredoxin-like domain-containing protein n=1 Tax=Bengtsoniella intestinalis TaxID=3073143 RepID=UPI00391F0717
MSKYICSICGYIHDEATGVLWDDLGADWVCPLCKADKSAFQNQEAKAKIAPVTETLELDDDLRELSVLEMSILCSNLAKGCEKQYQGEEAELFTKLATYFKAAAPAVEGDTKDLTALVEEDLTQHMVLANQIATTHGDRGAQRALVWGEKVTMILQSLLKRYAQEGDAMLAHTNVYVCTICGFIYIGDTPPELCPVCKVPSWKFERVEGGQTHG